MCKIYTAVFLDRLLKVMDDDSYNNEFVNGFMKWINENNYDSDAIIEDFAFSMWLKIDGMSPGGT